MSSIGGVNDFDSPDKRMAYSGIVPKVGQSNESGHRGRITKRGNNLARATLARRTLISIRYSGYLNGFYRRIKERRGAGKAIGATAGKPLKITFETLKNKWVFEDFTQFKIVSGEKTFHPDNHHRRRSHAWLASLEHMPSMTHERSL